MIAACGLIALLFLLGVVPVGTPGELLTVPRVCSQLPGSRGAKRLCPSTVTRWILAGCPARDGTRVKLKATRAGSRWLINPADLEEFFRQLAAEPTTVPSVPAAPVTDEKASERTRAASESLIRRGA